MDCLHGIIANLFTTFNEDGSLDDTGQCNFIDALLATGCVDTYFVRSGMGQMYALRLDEVKQIIRTACTHLDGKAPVLAGTSGIWNRDRSNLPDRATYTREAIELSQYAAEQGATAVVLTIPEGLAPTETETPFDVTRRYLESVCAAIQTPIVLYQPPSTAPDYQVTAETIKEISEFPNVKGIKVSTTDGRYILDICWATRNKDFCFIVGDEGAYYPGLCCGATAIIGQGACMYPAILQAVRKRFAAGDYEGAIDAQRSVNILRETRRCSNPVAFTKRYFAEQGYAMTTVRRSEGPGSEYVPTIPSLDSTTYESYKQLLESELARYVSQ